MLPAIELVTSSEINPKTFELASSNSRKILFAVVTSRSSWIVCIYACQGCTKVRAHKKYEVKVRVRGVLYSKLRSYSYSALDQLKCSVSYSY